MYLLVNVSMILYVAKLRKPKANMLRQNAAKIIVRTRETGMKAVRKSRVYEHEASTIDV